MGTEIYMTIITGLLGVIGFFLTRSFAALDTNATLRLLKTSWKLCAAPLLTLRIII